MSEYVDWLSGQLERMQNISIKIEGESGPEKARSLVKAMLDKGLAEKL